MSDTYTNPVYDRYFADPFVLAVDGTYYAYGTGSVIDGLAFEVLRSRDLVHWESLGGALEPVGPPGTPVGTYWAPEVVVVDGLFHLYYSVGEEDRGHRLRVATSERPEGPYVDAGVELATEERFAIDPHPFRDVDGQWYLFYARDAVEDPPDGDGPVRAGTTLAVDRLLDMTTPAGKPRTVLRATSDWQLFLAQREMYGEVVDWYTLEGPFVRRHGGRYYLFYSGGSWEEPGYGVAWAVADHPLGPWTEPEPGPTVLRSVPGQVVGPGHNSIVTGPDGEDYVVYHAWDPARTRRQMCIDRLHWSDAGPAPVVPTRTPQPVPGAAAPTVGQSTAAMP